MALTRDCKETVADERFDERLGTAAQQNKEPHHGKKTR